MIKLRSLPVSGRVAERTIFRETSSRVIWVGRAVISVDVTRGTITGGPDKTIVRMTLDTGGVGMRTRQGKPSSNSMVKTCSFPLRCVVASGTGLWKSC